MPGATDRATRRRAPRLLVACIVLVACGHRLPRVVVGDLEGGLDAYLAGHRAAADENIRVDLVARTETASYHLVQVRRGEAPHRHRTHDLTVVVLRGRGMLRLGERRIALAAGDAVLVPHGLAHWFTNGGSDPAVALAVFTPPLDAPDSEPAGDVD